MIALGDTCAFAHGVVCRRQPISVSRQHGERDVLPRQAGNENGEYCRRSGLTTTAHRSDGRAGQPASPGGDHSAGQFFVARCDFTDVVHAIRASAGIHEDPSAATATYSIVELAFLREVVAWSTVLLIETGPASRSRNAIAL